MWSRNFRRQYQKFATQITKHYCKGAPQNAACEYMSNELQHFKVGDTYHGFTVEFIQKVSELRLCAIKLLHECTGAEYLHLYRNDSNNLFAINFRTTPMDSKGAAHILEHTVLCGSALYPVRQSFFRMNNRSLATYMNAMTGPDYTSYPFLTQNETDYQNLQKIYLDAVFRPHLHEVDFMQEGWRLEHSDPRDIKSNLIIRGVVYNEMRGALAENGDIMQSKLLNNLLPDHTYGHISGGDPLVIPELTWEELKAFHKNHYHPSNTLFYSYGNFPLLPSLQYIEQEYLSKYEKIDVQHAIVPPQTRWKEARRIHVAGRFDNMGPPIEKQNYLAISLLMCDTQDIYDSFVLQFISLLAISGENAPFRKALVESNISGGFSGNTGYKGSTREGRFNVEVLGIQKEHFDEAIRIYDETVDDIIAKGFDKEYVYALLDMFELAVKHESSTFALTVLEIVMPLWNHDANVLKGLQINNLVDKLKSNLASDATYLQQFVKKYIKNNTHRLVVTMSPDLDYDKKYEAAEAKLLKDKIKKLTEKDKLEIYNKGLELLERQSAEQNADLLPTLQMTDIKGDVEYDNLTHTCSGPVPTQICPVNTRGITYFRAILSTTELLPQEVMMLPLFCNVINNLGTNEMNFLEFDTLVRRKTNGLNFGVFVGESIHQLHTYEPGIEISSYCLDENVTDMWNLWSQIFALDDLKDVKRFEMLVQMYMAGLTSNIVNEGTSYAIKSACALVSGSAYLTDQLRGLQHIAYMKGLVNTSNYAAILQELSKIGRTLFDKNKMRVALNISNESVDTVHKSFDNFVSSLPDHPVGMPDKITYVTSPVWTPVDAIQCQHHVLNSPVYFCSKSILTVPYVDPNYATLRVLGKLLSSKYLHTEVRERHGAYGGGAGITPDGVFTFYSYRDPRHLPTLDTFDSSQKWLQTEMQTITDQDILEAKLGVFRDVDSPTIPSEKGKLEFYSCKTPDILQRHRAEIMSVNKSQLSEVGEKYLSGGNSDVREGKVILGPKSKDMDLTRRKGELWTTFDADQRK